MTDHETAARALGFKLRDCNPEGDTFAAAVADALAAERAAGRAEGAREMRERAAAVARVGGALVCNAYAGMSERDCGRDDAAESIADDIEALPLDEVAP